MNESLDSMDGLRSKIELCLIAQLMANFFFFRKIQQKYRNVTSSNEERKK